MAPLKIVPGHFDEHEGRVGPAEAHTSVIDPAAAMPKLKGPNAATRATDSSCHDTMRFGPRTMASEIKAGHPLERRLAMWAETQERAKLEMQRRIYGIGVPARTVLERQVCGASTSHPALPSSSTLSNFSMDTLLDLDGTLTSADVFRYANGGVAAPHNSQAIGSDERYNDVSAQIERAYGISR